MSEADPFIGRTVAEKYRIDSRLGGGAMGVVYRATDSTGAACAVKVLQQEAVSDASLRERFEREAKALFGLTHPNILDVRDYGVDQGLPYLVMELLEGRTLEDMVVEHTPDPQTGFTLAKQVLSGLAHAHAHGVLHRDLKTENVFVVWDGQAWRAKLLDFGLVKFEDEDKWGAAKKLTVQGAVFGSPAYMSPEQATGSPMDARSDVYSMGIVLYELLTGEWPFEEESQMAMLRAHLITPVPPASGRVEGLVVRPEVEAIVQKAMAKKPTDRFADAGEMLAALEAVPSPAAWIAGATHVPPVPLAPPPSAELAPSPLAQTPVQQPPPASLPAPAGGMNMTYVFVGAAILAGVVALAVVGGALLFFMR